MQAFIKALPGIESTEAGRANGTIPLLESDYDGYAECVKTTFDPAVVSMTRLMEYFFEIIDLTSFNKQGEDVGEKYRTDVYIENPVHLTKAKAFISERNDSDLIVVEVLPLTNYVRSAEEHQDQLARCPTDYCHIPEDLINNYK